MDTEAEHTERDRSSEFLSGTNPTGTEERSRSARSPLSLGRLSLGRAGLLGVGCAVAVLLFSAFVVQPFQIPSGSMEPTLQVGDRVLVNKLAYRFDAEPERGDVVVFDGTGSFVQEPPRENPVTGLLHGAAAPWGSPSPPRPISSSA